MIDWEHQVHADRWVSFPPGGFAAAQIREDFGLFFADVMLRDGLNQKKHFDTIEDAKAWCERIMEGAS